MGKTKTVQKNEFDPKMQAMVTGNVDAARANLIDGYKPYTGQLSASQSPLMSQFFDAASALQGTGLGALGQAAGAAQKALSYEPMMIGPVSAGRASLYDASGAMGLLGNTATASGVNANDIARVGLADLDRAAIQQFFNPFEDTAVQSAIGDYEIARQRQGLNDAAAATAAKAFGGSRHGVADALTNEAFQRTSQGAINDLRLQGYNTAINGALTQRGQNLQGQMANQQADVSRAGINAETGRFNAGQQNDASKYAAGLLGQAGMFNADATNTRSESDANRLLQSLLANQDAGLAGAGLQLQGAGLLGNIGQAQSANALAQTSLLGQAGAAQQGLSQEALDREYAAWLQNYQNQLAGQQAVTSATGIVPGVTNSTQTTTQSQGLGGIAQGLLGSLGTAAFGLGSLGFTPFGAKK